MIPLKLSIQGLYSFREKQTIDFSKLTQAGLFGIFGMVGSGKSSVLEAISFALYGECERLNSRENRYYNMMNLKSNDLLIDFEFSALNNSQYRFVVKGKRNSKTFEDVKAFSRLAYKKEGEEWIPINVLDVEAVTGLNYKNFRRTIIIPQGRFQEFLQLNPGDRTTMLKELFNLSRFDLSDKVSRLESKNNEAIQQLTGQLQEVGEINPQQIEESGQQIINLKVDIQVITKELENKQELDRELENRKKLVSQIAIQQSLLQSLLKSETEINALDREVKEMEQISLIFRAELERMKTLERTISERALYLRALKETAGNASGKKASLVSVYSELKKDFDKKEQLKQEAGELRKLAEIRESDTRFESLQFRSLKGAETLRQTIGSVNNLKEQIKKTTEEIALSKKYVPDMKVLSAVREWFSRQNNLLNDQEEIRKRMFLSSRALEVIKDKTSALIRASGLFEEVPESTDLQDIIQLLEVVRSGWEKELDSCNNDLLHVRVQLRLETFASELEEGIPCPLCGSLNHPAILNPGQMNEQQEALITQKDTLERKIKDALRLEKALNGFQVEINTIGKQVRQDAEVLDQFTTKIKEHGDLFIWTDYQPDNEGIIKDALGKYDQLQYLIQQSEQALKANTAELERKETEKEKYTSALHEFDQQITALMAGKQLLFSQITHIASDQYNDVPSGELVEMADRLQHKTEENAIAFSKTEQELQAIRSELSNLSGKTEETENSLNMLNSEMVSLSDSLLKKCVEAGNLLLEDVVMILSKEINIDESKEKIEKYRQEVESLRKYLSELEKELRESVYDKESHDALKEEIAVLKKTKEEKTLQLGQCEKELTDLGEKAEKRVKLQKELEVFNLRAQDLTELKVLFRGSGFVNFVSTVFLENLARSANERFNRLTRQNLGLELAEDNSIMVRDYLNEGKLRSIKTLSGGQTFQASLALALSLADSIHTALGSAENFFFLDEGFGTLDKDSLDVVFETLTTLRKENRIVGVISHVEEMQQEIETYLRVTNEEKTGTLVKGSWEIP